jgi:hypothetical protein
MVLADPDRDRLAFAWSQLDVLRAVPARWGGRRGIYLPACGDTLIFEVRDDGGLTWVPAPEGAHAFVLSCDPGRQRDLADRPGGSSRCPRVCREWTVHRQDLLA